MQVNNVPSRGIEVQKEVRSRSAEESPSEYLSFNKVKLTPDGKAGCVIRPSELHLCTPDLCVLLRTEVAAASASHISYWVIVLKHMQRAPELIILQAALRSEALGAAVV